MKHLTLCEVWLDANVRGLSNVGQPCFTGKCSWDKLFVEPLAHLLDLELFLVVKERNDFNEAPRFGHTVAGVLSHKSDLIDGRGRNILLHDDLLRVLSYVENGSHV